MRRTVVLAICLLAAAAPLPARALEIRGTVVGPEGAPVAGAVVLHRDTGAKAVTDERGGFSLAVKGKGRVRLEVIHPDHYEQEFVLSQKEAARGAVLTIVPLVRRAEEVVVTALRRPEALESIPVAEAVVPRGALAEELSANVTDGLARTPGVAALGSGGFSLVPSIRGLARRRVLYLIDGARLSSERRTGPNASFVAPEDVDRIEVVRSGASVLYGSDAIGGIVHILTREPEVRDGVRGRLTARYGTANAEKGAGLVLEAAKGSTGLLLSLQGVDADDYRAPSGVVARSRYGQGSLSAKVVHRTARREVVASVLAARGADIGKPNRDASTKPTWYPEETQNLVQVRWIERGVWAGDLSFRAFVNPNSLETRTDRIDGYRTKTSTSLTKSTESGAQLSFGRSAVRDLRLEAGADLFAQSGAEATTKDVAFAPDGAVTSVSGEVPYTKGRRTDAGIFLTADYSAVGGLDLVGGLRWDRLSMTATPAGGPAASTRNDRVTGFLAASGRLAKDVTAFVNLARAYRVPSLNERYYTGISGRGFIIAQPGLRPESSLNLDGGVKVFGRRLFLGLYAFTYAIDDMIERYTLSPGIYGYGNIEKGRLKGLELEAEVFPVPGWKVFGNAFAIRGRSAATGAPLNDVPPVQVLAGTKVWAGRMAAEVTAVLRFRKTDPGPAEVPIGGSMVLSAGASYRLSPALSFYATLFNILDAAFVARPDAEAMEEPGRSLKLGFSFAF